MWMHETVKCINSFWANEIHMLYSRIMSFNIWCIVIPLNPAKFILSKKIYI